ncbi:MAG: bifunctional diaminohydroxyphosphoribosylaminopyrimidine deaminase/5-amino-6-(5-phosphoribosylamino)uracil reductase RibD [Alphaproteobacteria bacterium]|nr:bifunctional diaminohydroxyphosphoribosylaminopyrimidine deaminase/5-amino-6-(5-phosphoribosylamino)uracil reductase RibD [Alphaproteobacteria bacterium]
MRHALALGRRTMGQVAPNPAVGCVIVAPSGQVIGRGFTQASGRPHAETQALAMAGVSARGATAYVTLEPCAHHGKTPPCADALIKAGVARVVIAIGDPDPRTAGKGAATLRQAGIDVIEGVLAAEARRDHAGFFSRVQQGRPLVALKLAATLDGRIATATGESLWITGELARAHGHLLRASHDAILVGIGTALADNPSLDCRLPGMAAASPQRIVVDSRLRLALTSRLVTTAHTQPTIIIAGENAERPRLKAFLDSGVRVLLAPRDTSGNLDLGEALRTLGDEGFTRVLVEGGHRIAASLIRIKALDLVHWYRAGRLIGGDGLAALAGFGLKALTETPRLRLLGRRDLGEDVVESFAVSY